MDINMQKGFAPIATIIILLLIIGGGAYSIKKVIDKKAEKDKAAVETSMPVPGADTKETEVTPEPPTNSSAVSKDIFAGWKTYENAEYSFKHPPTWNLEVSNSGTRVSAPEKYSDKANEYLLRASYLDVKKMDGAEIKQVTRRSVIDQETIEIMGHYTDSILRQMGGSQVDSSYTRITFLGYPAVKMLSDVTRPYEHRDRSLDIFVIKGEQVYVLHSQTKFSRFDSYKGILEQVTSSFTLK